VAVTDTGMGMAPEVLEHIFEPFYTTKGSGGTGLGLSSVYGIIKQTGGFIWCESEPGAGATFKIYLPPAKGAADTAPEIETPVEPVRGGAETILVVDDERAVRQLLTHILRARGYTVIPAEDAKTALGVLNGPGQHVDLVVSDIVMHGMSGTRLVEEIQTRWPDMKLLFVSGYSQGVALQPDSPARKVPLLGKPFTPARLESMVRDILDGVEARRGSAVKPE
jgi:two-component system cell cycle sensor histidine kinase/response regulator CckA